MAAGVPTPFPDRLAATSERRLALGVLAPSMVAIACVAALAVTSLSLLSALRAYAAGESQWSQSRALAVDALRDYARTRDTRDYERFEQALRVPLADRVAREELERPLPNLDIVRRGLITGDNHPTDVDSMLLLYRRFGWLPSFQASLQAWREGDELIAQLHEVALGLREQLRREAPQVAEVDPALQRVSLINRELNRVERRFTGELGDAGRMVERVLIGSVMAMAAVLAALGLWLVRRSLQSRAARERELAQANERWALAAEAGGLGLYDWIVQSDELQMDARAAAMYGLAVEGGHGLVTDRATLSALLLPQDLPETRRALDECLAGGSRFRSRYRVRRPEGSVRHLEAMGVMQGDSATGSRLVGVVRDVTEEEQRVQVARERDVAERAARSRMEFLSRLSHELRTPLNAILGFAQLLAMDGANPLAAGQAQRVRLILDSGRQLLKLVEDVLDLTRIDSGGVSVDIESVDVAAALRTSLALVDGVAQSFGIRLQDQAPQAPLLALADPRRLQQVLMNLLTNACKYNRRGGSATVRAWRDGPCVRVSVADTGPGLTEGERAELFQPFHRLPSTAGQVEGTGLGLFIVKALVERMSGHIEVDSTWGVGSCFTVVLPACEQQQGALAA